MLKLLGGLGLAAALPATRAGADPGWTAIGYSQGGLPLVVHHLGAGRRRIFILGGQHGGPEANTIALVAWLQEFFANNPTELPGRLGLPKPCTLFREAEPRRQCVTRRSLVTRKP